MATRQEFRGMKGLKKQRRIQIIALAAVALIGATATDRLMRCATGSTSSAAQAR